MDLILTLDALLRDRISPMRPRGWASASQQCLPARHACACCLVSRCLSLPHTDVRCYRRRAPALRPQVATVLQGIAAMLEPTTFNAQNSNRTFVIALHENPALMLGQSCRIRLAVRHRVSACVLRSRKPSCCQRRWKMAMWIFISALTRGRTMHGSNANCLTMNMPQPSGKAIRAVRGRWIWKAIVVFHTGGFIRGRPVRGLCRSASGGAWPPA